MSSGGDNGSGRGYNYIDRFVESLDSRYPKPFILPLNEDHSSAIWNHDNTYLNLVFGTKGLVGAYGKDCTGTETVITADLLSATRSRGKRFKQSELLTLDLIFRKHLQIIKERDNRSVEK